MSAVSRIPTPGACAAVALALACLMVGFSPPSTAQTLGRLFFSVDERFQLNQRREDDDSGPGPVPTRGEIPLEPTPAVGEVSFDGRVERADGQTTIWVNGEALLPGNSTVEGIRVAPTGGSGGETSFTLPSGAGFKLKVGQKVQVVSGKVLDSYESKPRKNTESVFSAAPGSAPGGAFSASPGAPGAPNSPLLNAPVPSETGVPPAGQARP